MRLTLAGSGLASARSFSPLGSGIFDSPSLPAPPADSLRSGPAAGAGSVSTFGTCTESVGSSSTNVPWRTSVTVVGLAAGLLTATAATAASAGAFLTGFGVTRGPFTEANRFGDGRWVGLLVAELALGRPVTIGAAGRPRATFATLSTTGFAIFARAGSFLGLFGSGCLLVFP